MKVRIGLEKHFYEILSFNQMSVYAAQFVHDLNGDGTPEILAVHGGDELSDPGEFWKKTSW